MHLKHVKLDIISDFKIISSLNETTLHAHIEQFLSHSGMN